MSEKTIDIKDRIDYAKIGDVINELIELRKTYGSNCIIDIDLEPVPYENRDEIAVNLIVRED